MYFSAFSGHFCVYAHPDIRKSDLSTFNLFTFTYLPPLRSTCIRYNLPHAHARARVWPADISVHCGVDAYCLLPVHTQELACKRARPRCTGFLPGFLICLCPVSQSRVSENVDSLVFFIFLLPSSLHCKHLHPYSWTQGLTSTCATLTYKTEI